MQKRRLVAAFVAAVSIGPLAAQAWTVERLQDEAQGFHEEGILPRLRQIARLLGVEEDAYPAVSAAIHGDHREYLVKIRRLLDQLADERWLAREEAERSLIEIGGRAVALITETSKTGGTLEERIRSERVLRGIADRGREREEAEIRLLRGFTALARYLEPSPKLARSLVSAVGHTDPQVVAGAIRALGAVGGDEQAHVVFPFVTPQTPTSVRRVAVCALARMQSEKALTRVLELLERRELPDALVADVLRELRQRDDAAAIHERLATSANPLVAAAVALEVGDGGDAVLARITLPDRTELERPLLVIGGDSLRVEDPVPGLSTGEFLLADCDVLDFPHALQPIADGHVVLFLTQGSLVTGKLVGIDADAVTIESPWFGTVRAERANVQGLTLDPSLDRLVGASNRGDRLRLMSAELVDGRVESIVDGELRFTPEAADTTAPAFADVAGILFARPPNVPQNADVFTRVSLVSGDRILAYLVGASSESLAIVAPGLGSCSIPFSKVTRVEFGVGGGALWGYTLIADYSENRILEVNDKGEKVFSMEEVYGAWDVECLDSGNLLVTEFALNRVMEITREGDEVWSYEELKNPNDADRLANGNTLIADTFGDRVIEVDPDKNVVWEFADQIKPYDVERLANGNTLIADGRKERAIEVTPGGEIVWSIDGLHGVHDVDRLPNGNTLITQRTMHRVVEVDRDGNEVFRIEKLSSPSDADRLPNGHTLVAENGRISEFDRKGNKVWEKEISWAVEVNRY